jgi:hypothetical protein
MNLCRCSLPSFVVHCNQHAHAKAAEQIWHGPAAAATDAATGVAAGSATAATASSALKSNMQRTAAADIEAAAANEPLVQPLAAGDTPAGDAPPRRAVASYWLMDEMATLGIKPDAYTYSFAISEVRAC